MVIGEDMGGRKKVIGIIARSLWMPTWRDLVTMGCCAVVLAVGNLFVPWGPHGGSLILHRVGERAADLDFAAWITAVTLGVGVVFIALGLVIRRCRGTRH